jgi:hypothetical protein
MEEERKVEGGGECTSNKENGSLHDSKRGNGRKRVKKEVGEVKERRVKEQTGQEVHKIIKEKKELQEAKRAKTEARKMVRNGKMRTLNKYFERRSSMANDY